ncbi:uncharacterized protein I303_102299 [Kwoniella dejecticola CBS 10117]|uniref:DEK C-terminal domain-containing protein n=1 Tax=Kwoniella dejecticola CBS 10117 TaxID=1296121 RepID=A0A1A6ABD2_9TREE|nr:uncharacterized protein I303_01561 [Kwoniella dejecticola CBS 10117]OBR87359.1 hypothetical protein I303_01561 [Kwoniella dejecticola CBS 10117]
MDESLLPTLRSRVTRIVGEAARPGGLIDQDGFTMNVARSRLEESMGFEQGELGEKRWKKVVKELVNWALDQLAPDDSDDEVELHKASSSKNPFPSPESSPSPKKRKATDLVKSAAQGKKSHTSQNYSTSKREMERDPADEPKTRLSSMKQKKPSKSSRNSPSPEAEEEEEEQVEEIRQARMSDSMSSVYDEPPSRSKSKSKSKNSTKGSKQKSKSVLSDEEDEEEKPAKRKKGTVNTKAKKKDPNEGLSPDEARVADLKRTVVACGVRKQWAKEFANCPTTSSQIRHLQNLLSSLGMKGTPTLGKAKSLKEKRELAQELDDVTTFEAARGVSADTDTQARRTRGSVSSQPTKKKRKIVASDESDEEGQDEPEELDKEESALGAVMDFLGGDSDSD